MPKTALVAEDMTDDKLSKKGEYLVVELKEDLDILFPGFDKVLAGTRGIVIGTDIKNKTHAVMFPHTSKELKVFSDGRVRTMPGLQMYNILGRIDKK